MSTDTKFSKTQISKIIQSWGFLGSLLSKIAGPLMKVAIPLEKKVLAQEFKKNTWSWNKNFNNFKWRNEWYNENCLSSWRY